MASPLLNEIASFVHDMCSRKPGTGVYDRFSSNGMLDAKNVAYSVYRSSHFFFLFWRCVPIIKIFYRKQGCHTKCAMVLFLSNPGVHGVCSETKFVLRHPSGRGWLPAHVADDWLRSIPSWTGGGEGCKGSACVSPWIATNDMLLT